MCIQIFCGCAFGLKIMWHTVANTKKKTGLIIWLSAHLCLRTRTALQSGPGDSINKMEHNRLLRQRVMQLLLPYFSNVRVRL